MEKSWNFAFEFLWEPWSALCVCGGGGGVVMVVGVGVGRVPTVREKSVKNEKSSRSGKSQGILI